MLTKRPGNVLSMVPREWLDNGFPPYVRVGTSVGTQFKADIRIPTLLDIRAPNFLSIEPLLEGISLPRIYELDWVIVGPESGPGARLMDLDWARSIRDECKAVGVPFFMKKMATKVPLPEDLRVQEYPLEKTP